MHPLLLHSGTTNAALRPRLLANGVARLVRGGDGRYAGGEVEGQETSGTGWRYQCPLLARDVARLGLTRAA
jgi:hypothetical protein